MFKILTLLSLLVVILVSLFGIDKSENDRDYGVYTLTLTCSILAFILSVNI